MAAAKSNSLLKFGVPLIVIAIIFITVYAIKGTKNKTVTANQENDIIYNLTEEEQKELNLVAGDTPFDTLKTLLSTVKQTRADVETVKEHNSKLKQENSILKANAENINQKIEDAILDKQQQLEMIFSQRLSQLEENIKNQELNPNNSSNNGANDIPIGFGSTSPVTNGNETMWIEPSDIQYTDKNGNPTLPGDTNAIPSLPNLFKTLDNSTVGKATDKLTGKKSETITEEPQSIPYYTIPENSTLVGSVAMTALIGRVPIEGALTDPFPFKIMIGQENLMANGIELPDVEGAIVSGTASGDWTLSCVTGKVNKITFIFSDGRVQTLPSSKNNSSESIGWLSTPTGVPCIAGERKTNAAAYLSSQFLLSGANAAAQGLSQSQTTTIVDGNSVVGAVTGNQGKYILGQALGGGLKETADWFRQRYGQMFDAIYVPPGQQVVVNITQSLNIDYDFNARKVKYNNNYNPSHLD